MLHLLPLFSAHVPGSQAKSSLLILKQNEGERDGGRERREREAV